MTYRNADSPWTPERIQQLMDSHWEPSKTQLKRLREIADGDNGMGGRHHRLPTMSALIGHGLIAIRTVYDDNDRPHTGYFLTEKGAQVLDDIDK